METTLNIRIDQELKDKFTKALLVGRPATITDTIEHFMTAYVEAVTRDGRQPEFPFEIRSKEPKK